MGNKFVVRNNDGFLETRSIRWKIWAGSWKQWDSRNIDSIRCILNMIYLSLFCWHKAKEMIDEWYKWLSILQSIKKWEFVRSILGAWQNLRRITTKKFLKKYKENRNCAPRRRAGSPAGEMLSASAGSESFSCFTLWLSSQLGRAWCLLFFQVWQTTLKRRMPNGYQAVG